MKAEATAPRRALTYNLSNVNKKHILQEIKRTAKENGGAALGMKKFKQETGIKIGDWLGRHWTRWGDAIREAGFTPNQMKTAYDESLLMEKYIALTRELGKLPVRPDMQLKRRRDPDFPDPLTFGLKRELVKRVATYCENRSGYEDVLLLCEQYIAPRSTRTPENAGVVDGEIGFVYLMKAGKFYKIGKSNSAGRREYEIRLQVAEKLTAVHAIPTDDPTGIEGYWHRRFAAKRKNGEWFDLDAADVSAFKRRKFM
jgi:hypothetical protein